MINSEEVEIEEIEIFDKSRNILIQVCRKPRNVIDVLIDEVINETVMSKFFILI